MFYCVNIVTKTKTGDLFTAVAVNKYPLCVTCEDYEEFLETIKEDYVEEFISASLKTKFLFDNAVLYVRSVNYETGEHEEFSILVPDHYTFREGAETTKTNI